MMVPIRMAEYHDWHRLEQDTALTAEPKPAQTRSLKQSAPTSKSTRRRTP
jgi:hypothetical protein